MVIDRHISRWLLLKRACGIDRATVGIGRVAVLYPSPNTNHLSEGGNNDRLIVRMLKKELARVRHVEFVSTYW